MTVKANRPSVKRRKIETARRLVNCGRKCIFEVNGDNLSRGIDSRPAQRNGRARGAPYLDAKKAWNYR